MKYLFFLLIFICSYCLADSDKEPVGINPYYAHQFQQSCNSEKLKIIAKANLEKKLSRLIIVEITDSYVLEEDHKNLTAICGLSYTLTDQLTKQTRKSEFKFKIKLSKPKGETI